MNMLMLVPLAIFVRFLRMRVTGRLWWLRRATHTKRMARL